MRTDRATFAAWLVVWPRLRTVQPRDKLRARRFPVVLGSLIDLGKVSVRNRVCII